MQVQWTASVLLLLVCAAGARAQDCWAVETDLKYNIPSGVYGTFGGCVKGTKSSDGSYCQPEIQLQGTRAEGTPYFGSLSACCDSLEPRVKVDPRNGQPRTDQVNVKSVCNSYKKPAAPAPAPAPASSNVCFSVETDLKYNIPQGVYGTFGGCVKGTKSSDGNYCQPDTQLQYTRAEGSPFFGSLSACCDSLEPRVKVDPRNGQPRTDQVNVKSVCNSYKKPAAPAPAPAPASSNVCFSVETDLKYNIPQGVHGTFGGCVKGTKSSDGNYCQPDTQLQGTRAEGTPYFGSLSACCDSLEPRVKVDPRNGQPRTDQVNVKSVCNSYKKPAAQKPAAQPPTRTYMVFRGYDLPGSSVDLKSNGNPFTKVCGGRDAVGRACAKNSACVAFTFGAENDCGYLKKRVTGESNPPTVALQNTGRGWDSYVFVGAIPKALGGELDCADGKNSGNWACKLSGGLPGSSGSVSA